mgnify:CR=1 FL=1
MKEYILFVDIKDFIKFNTDKCTVIFQKIQFNTYERMINITNQHIVNVQPLITAEEIEEMKLAIKRGNKGTLNGHIYQSMICYYF